MTGKPCPDGAAGPAGLARISSQVEVPVCGQWFFPGKPGPALARSADCAAAFIARRVALMLARSPSRLAAMISAACCPGGQSPMADPSAAAPVGVAMSGQDVLLATKLHVPRPQPGFVPRRRLVEAPGEGVARGLVLACAPAGSGKTALLADWARGGGRAVAWLALDGGDSDPARFWRYAVAALDLARPGLAGRVGPLPPPSSEGLVTALVNELAADPGPDEVLLVLDDYHLVDSGPVHESVAFLPENPQPGLRVVVSGRSGPPLPLARLRGRGQLAELRSADLRFTSEEAAALLGETAGPGVPTAAARALAARTEGWAAALQLAGLSLRGQADAAGFVAAFSGSHRFVLDYLADEVLDGQTGRVRAALWFKAFGMTDLVVALTLGALTGFRAAQHHSVQCADHRAAARADPDSDRAAVFRPAHHGRVLAGEGSAGTSAGHRPGHCHRGIDRRFGTSSRTS